MRTAQRNLNKLLMGDGDESDSMANCGVSATATVTKSSMLELDAMMESSQVIVPTHVQDDFAAMVLKKEPIEATSVLNGDCTDALKNDVKMNQYNMFNSFFMPNSTSSNLDNQMIDHTQLHHHHLMHHNQPLHHTTQSSCGNLIDTHAYDPMGTNNNNKGVRNALMSEIGSFSPLGHQDSGMALIVFPSFI